MRYNVESAFRAAAKRCAELANLERNCNRNEREAFDKFMAFKEAERAILALIPTKRSRR